MIQKNRREAVVFIASAVTQPPDITSWLISLCLEDVDNIKDSNVVELLFNKNFSRNNLQILRKAVLSEEHLAWMEKLQNIKTNLLSSSITNIQTAKGRKISKSKGQNKRSEKKCKKDVNKKVKPKGKSSKMKSKTASDDLPKRKRKKAKLHKKEKLSKSDKKESTRKTRKSSKAKLKMLSNNKIKHEISDSRKETKSERLDLDQDKGKKQIASDCENEDQNSMECDSMKKLEPSLSKEECQLNQCTVINSEPSSALSNGVDKPELSTSEGICKLNLSVLDNNKPSFVESAETVNSINDINESELSSSKAPCQLNLSTVDSFGQYENDLGSSLDVINETELLCLQESCHFTQAVTNDRRNESEMSINMPTIISELDDRQNESVTEIPKSMPVLVPESLENNADDTSCTVGMATVADLIQSEGKDCQADKLIMNSNDYFTTVENYLLDERNLCDASCSTNCEKASEAIQTVEKQFDEKSCQTDELIMNSNEYFMTAGNNILHEENQINASCSENDANALSISEVGFNS
ncbi:uncharacterized protein LOC129233497 [Uloborus diversus]|uniref:uncharacterized protein LOC129233497 n=1 Tax=Uloborus diversus TaxID=327109 RepID=UPI00240A83C3|nr:uncharacterized protein LOC129233497 [Uloborus diversus]